MANIPPKYPLFEYLKVEQESVAKVKKVMEQAAKDIEKDILAAANKKGVSGRVTRLQLQAQKAAINEHLGRDIKNVGNITANGQQAAAKKASEVVSQYELTLQQMVADKDKLELVKKSAALQAASTYDTVMARQQSSHIPLSKQVYQTGKVVSGQVDNMINSALARGLTWKEFAAEAKSFVSPTTPGGASYAANRLARTEINNAFHSSALQRFQDSGLCTGVDWNLSSSHPEGDECDTFASESPYDPKKVPSKPHPFCLCYVTPALPSEEEFLENLLNGDYDDEDWAKEVDKPAVKAKYKPSGLTPEQKIKAAETRAKNKAAKEAAAKEAALKPKVLSKEEKWLGKAMPKKPLAPMAPKTTGEKAFADWEAKVSKRFADFAAKTGNLKNDIKKSNNWVKFQNVIQKNHIGSLDELLAGKYIDQDLYDDAIKAMKAAKKVDPKDAAAFKKASAEFTGKLADYDIDILDWREINGIKSTAKGMEGAIDWKTNQAGVAWAKKNLAVAEGASRTAAKTYTGGSYHAWNDALRAAKGKVPTGQYAEMTKNLDKAFAPVPEDIIVHRGTSWIEFARGEVRSNQLPPPPPTDMIGSVQTNYGYMSTSVGKEAAFNSKPVNMRIRVPAGEETSYVQPYSNFPQEREMMLKRNSNLYIHDVYPDPNKPYGGWIVDAEVIPDGVDASTWVPMPSARR